MTTKSMSYDHPAYLARHSAQFGANAAGAASVTSKFLAWTAMHVFSINVTTVTPGTSTYTAWNGTATVTTTGTGDSISAIKISGTATSTYGPYALDAAAAGFRQIAISQTGVGSNTADGGVALAQGDTLYLVRGTDATAVEVTAVEYSLDPETTVTK